MSLKAKAWLLSVLVLLALVGVMLVGLLTMKTAANNDNKARIEQLLRSTYLTIVQMENMAASGKLTEEQAKAIATQILRENKYHKSEYVYVVDEKLNFVATPLDPQLHGTSFNEFKDAQKNSVGSLAVAALQKSGGALTEYAWNSERDGKIVDLLTVVIQSPRWHWIVGNGVSEDEANTRFWSNARWQVIICLIVAAVVAAILLMAVQKLLRQLGGEPDYAADIALAISQGDLGRRIDGNVRPDSLLGAVASMQNSLRDMIQGIQRGADELKQAAGGLSHQMDAISQASRQSSDATSATAAAIEQMSVSVDHISQSARETEQNSSRSSELATEGEGLVAKAAVEIQRVSSQIADASGLIGGLVERSREIDSIASVIKDIADQTNLLALNAAIEAARAGEQGRGFAVVADEVRKLAERTTQATGQITSMIQAVQADTLSVVASMDEATPQVARGVEMADRAAATLREISSGASETLGKIRDVANATSEQSLASSSVATNVEHIARMVEESADSVRAANENVRTLEQLATDLRSQVARFRL
ncbi:methyl-accepting chemotaxis protein [Andreprevotia lacus DSM 23236]|jgi:methyl-accepting chemotaxis protein|uniref:Methyl-accepting chemotaxis protein n=1 Tax=Andreprevotia lacus DSM 23236 TaxID=1121001 RepID=A0A1W1X2N0_9NEIS|nr:methyl-accepting chemotaxis protein [Andreprevotia lacus]SMC18157.1 methyl-accepting chemotaxis protein [Andreprevotia lacus DSM 23236]